jgi:histidinol-phosphatase (PHP family)
MEIIMFDLHIHSTFSADSKMDAIDACNASIAIGLQGIAFTDHLDIDFPGTGIEFMIDFDTYSPFMDNLKNKFKSQLKVLKGIEVGIQPHVMEQTSEIVNKYDFDYVLGSIHILNKLDPCDPEHRLYLDRPQKEVYRHYLNEILFMIRNFKDFDVLGHIDYIRRYDCNDVKLLLYKDYTEVIDEVLKELIAKGKGYEINTGGFRYKLDPALADINILKRYKELGGEIVCTGSDAHSTRHIADGFESAKEMLINAGFKYFTYFEKRSPVFIKL